MIKRISDYSLIISLGLLFFYFLIAYSAQKLIEIFGTNAYIMVGWTHFISIVAAVLIVLLLGYSLFDNLVLRRRITLSSIFRIFILILSVYYLFYAFSLNGL